MTAERARPMGERVPDTGDGLRGRLKAFPRSGPADPRDRTLDAEYGLPPPPGDKAPLALRQMWDRIFGEPVTLLEFIPELLPVDPKVRILRRERATLSTGGHAEDSGNWAGAFATATGSKHLGTMLGIWQVPPKMDVPAGKTSKDYSCSIWIGLDGQRRYFDSSLPQIGTLTQFADDGCRIDYPWVQWWERDSTTNGFVQLKSLTIAPCEWIGAFLHVVDATHVWFVIVNLNSHKNAIAFMVSAPVGGAQPVVFGATAEWVVERPSHVGLTTKYDLPDFGACQLEGLALQTAQIGAALYDGDLRDMSSARMIRMLEVRDDPPRTAIIAMPHRAGPTGVNVTYGGF